MLLPSSWYRFRTAIDSSLSAKLRAACLSTICLIAGCVTTTGAAGGADQASAPGEPIISVKWLPPCQLEGAEAYFSVDIFPDGGVRYIGGRQAKEVGERRDHVAPADLRRMLVSVGAFRASQASSQAPQAMNVRSDASYCIEVKTHDASGVRASRVRSDVASARKIIRSFRDVVHAEKWVCPARRIEDPQLSLLYQRPFCNDADNPLVVSFRVADESTCASFHRVLVYRNGLTYYSAVQDAPTGRERHTVFDTYLELRHDAVKQLIADVRRSKLVHQEMIAESPTKGPFNVVDPDLTGFVPEDMDRLKQTLGTVLGIQWFAFSGDGPGCQYRGPPSEVKLSGSAASEYPE